MVIERKVKDDGSTMWRVPGWFVTVTIAVAFGWGAWVTKECLFSHSQLSVGGRFTEEMGARHADRIERLEKTLPPSWLVQDVEELKETTRENKKLIELNHDLLLEISLRK